MIPYAFAHLHSSALILDDMWTIPVEHFRSLVKGSAKKHPEAYVSCHNIRQVPAPYNATQQAAYSSLLLLALTPHPP